MSFGTACSVKEIIPVHSNVVCPAPKEIVLKPLDNTLSISNEVNVRQVMLNIADLMAYIGRLKNTIGCYEKMNRDEAIDKEKVKQK